MFDFRRITLFCLEKRLSKHKMTIFSKNLGRSIVLLAAPGYAYDGTSQRYTVLNLNTICSCHLTPVVSKLFYRSPDHLFTFSIAMEGPLHLKPLEQNLNKVCVVVQTQAICNCRITATAVIWFTSYFPNLSFFQSMAQGEIPKNPGNVHKAKGASTYYIIR